jgi:HEAT repeat protein
MKKNCLETVWLALALALTLAAAGCWNRSPLRTGQLDAVTADDLRALKPAEIEDKEERATVEDNALQLLERRRSGNLDAATTVETLIAVRLLNPPVEKTLPAVLPLLEDSDRNVRYYALRVLALYPDEEDVRQAVEPLKSSQDVLFAGEARLIAP